jgi:hypothetical protein
MSDIKKDDIVYVTGYARVRFKVKEIKPKAKDPFHLVYAAVNGDAEKEFGWANASEIELDQV